MNGEKSDEDASDKCAEISDTVPLSSESDSVQQKEVEILYEAKQKRKSEDNHNMPQKIKKVHKGKETKKDKALEWNYFYSNVTFGIWIQCTKCNKWRRSTNYEEDHQVPTHWHCSMNSSGIKSCDDPEDTEGIEFSPVTFIPGSIVWAKVEGYPWWPGMIEDDPDIEEYYWFEDKTTYYNVTFLDNKISHAWVPASFVRSYLNPPNQKFRKGKSSYLIEAEKNANKAMTMSIKNRLKNFSFAECYQGKWPAAENFGDDEDDDIAEIIKELEDIESMKSFDSGTEIDNSDEEIKESNVNLSSKNLQKQKLSNKAKTKPIISQQKARKNNTKTDSKSEIKMVHDYMNERHLINDDESSVNKGLEKVLEGKASHQSHKRKKMEVISCPVKKCINTADNYNTQPTEKKIEHIKGMINSKLNEDILAQRTEVDIPLKSGVKKKKTEFTDASKSYKNIKNKLVYKDTQPSKNVLQTNSNKTALKPLMEVEQECLHDNLGDKKEQVNKNVKNLENSNRNVSTKFKPDLKSTFKPPVKSMKRQNKTKEYSNVQNQNEIIDLQDKKVIQKHEMDENTAITNAKQNILNILEKNVCSKKSRQPINTISKQGATNISDNISKENEIKEKTASHKNSECKKDKSMDDNSNERPNDLNAITLENTTIQNKTKDLKMSNDDTESEVLNGNDQKLPILESVPSQKNPKKFTEKKVVGEKISKSVPNSKKFTEKAVAHNKTSKPVPNSKNPKKFTEKEVTPKKISKSVPNSKKSEKLTIKENTLKQKSKNQHEIEANNKDGLKMIIGNDFEKSDQLENSTDNNTDTEELEGNSISNKYLKQKNASEKDGDEIQDNINETQNSFPLLLKSNEEETENEDSDPFETD